MAVFGATGRTGRLVVDELFRMGCTKVVAPVRNASKAAEVLTEDERLVILPSDDEAIRVACSQASAAVWCAEGEGVAAVGAALAEQGPREDGLPRVVMCSSAAVTRPTWSDARKQRFPGAADIPIVRLNPGDILGGKRTAEDLLRKSGSSYAIVRPTGLKDDAEWPAGRPILSQGDVAVGRITRSDVASLLVQLLREPEAAGKTFEAVSVAGYPKPRDGYGQALARLRPDGARGPGPLGRLRALLAGVPAADAATYGLMQQLLPGEGQDSAGIAMGQTYEQQDRGEEGRLGQRGEERVPQEFSR